MDMLPANDDLDAQLYGIVSDPAAFNRLALLAPKMQSHVEWFEKLRVAIVQEFSDSETQSE
jgi:hypothetical protein